MFHYFLVFFLLILLLATLSVFAIIGRKIGAHHLKSQLDSKLEIIGAAEGALFGLLALLMAFTFSGAYERYETRKTHLIEEANTFDRVYNYIDLLPKDMQPAFREDVRQYFDEYITIFKNIANTMKVNQDLSKAQYLEDKIWKATVKANLEATDKNTSQIYVMAFSDMFETAHTGYYWTQVHPPMVIFILLVGLAALGSFLIGYNAAENKRIISVHVLCYVLLTAVTIDIIINIEFASIGFIGLDIFDQILLTVRGNMN